RVAVFERESDTRSKPEVRREEIILLPNQKVVYFEESHELITGLVEDPKIIPPTSSQAHIGSFVFDEVPLQTVLSQLEKSYGISSRLENELQNECPLTPDLSELTLCDQLDMTCAATKSRYPLSGTSIIISGEG